MRVAVVAAALALLAFVLADVSAPEAGGGTRPSYDLRAAYPNERRQGAYFLRGVNVYGSSASTSGPQRTSLWFQPQPDGTFKQFNTTPYRTCHWDLLRWGAGNRGTLVYLATHAECYAQHTAIVFRPGISFMPKTWAPGERWVAHGVSGTVYSEDGTAVCAGTNAWRSQVVGVEPLPSGAVAVHTQTNETQTLSAIAGAPSSGACPPGRPTSFGWQENFYVGGGLTVRQQDGSAAGSDLGLVRSSGGNADARRVAGHPDWDSIFDSWNAFPPADAGTVSTAPTRVGAGSTGNTVAVTYTAPASGLQEGSVTVVVPAGWTPPTTDDAKGCAAASAGTVTASGQAVVVSGLTLSGGERLEIAYGATAGGACTPGDGATAPSTPGAPLWQVQSILRPGMPFTNLPSSVAITVGAS